MKKRSRIAAAVLAAAIVLTSGGCSLNFFSIESLMSPPALTGKNGEIQSAFLKLTGSQKLQLKTPVKGNYQSSFVCYDVDGDSEDEVLVFYTDSSIDNSARMAAMDCINGTWVISADIKGSGSGVYDVDFADLNGDGQAEVFVSWSLYDSKTTRILSVFEPSAGETGGLSLNLLATENYSYKYFTDFDADGRTDLVLIYPDDTAVIQNSYFRVFNLTADSTWRKYGEMLLDSAITSVSAIQSDMTKTTAGTITRLFIDCLKTDTSMITEVVYWSRKKNTPVRAVANPAADTLRTAKILSRDIDADGLYEVPVTASFPGDPKQLSINVLGEPYTFSMLRWEGVAGDVQGKTSYTLYNPLHHYLFRFPWRGEVTVRYDANRSALVFCYWDAAHEESTDELFAIHFHEGADEAYVTDELTLLYAADEGDYYLSVTDIGTEFGITKQEIIEDFIIIKQGVTS